MQEGKEDDLPTFFFYNVISDPSFPSSFLSFSLSVSSFLPNSRKSCSTTVLPGEQSMSRGHSGAHVCGANITDGVRSESGFIIWALDASLKKRGFYT